MRHDRPLCQVRPPRGQQQRTDGGDHGGDDRTGGEGGTDTFRDISEFPPLDPDDETWGKAIAILSPPEEALNQALDQATSEPGVNPTAGSTRGIICDEYRDFRIAGRNENPATP
ncbi:MULTISPECIES: hypothetical protein [unclassified Streptomyces]|uniref:hypothetical protein n=1 Tax=unclassified Streptomyces TaxID=2593676 RepID=UPI00382B8A74